jgi:putative transposase
MSTCAEHAAVEMHMGWKTILAYVTGWVGQELLPREEYLVTENRILCEQIKGRIRLSDGERKPLAEIGKELGKQAFEGVASVVEPDAILAWHRTLIAQKFNSSPQRKGLGRPKIDRDLEVLVACLARENR